MLLKLYFGKMGFSKLVSTLKAENNKCFEHKMRVYLLNHFSKLTNDYDEVTALKNLI